jgi:release factor glutamine methyltransferase
LSAPPLQPAPPRDARGLVTRGQDFLQRKGVDSPRLEAELLGACALGVDRLALFLDLQRPVSEEERVRARGLLVRRAAGEPTAYLVGVREFYGRAFQVGPAVLIPRPETELVVDLARERAAGRQGLRVLDVGTGSGCLAVTLALELDRAEVLATDRFEAVLELAHANARSLAATLELKLADGLDGVEGPFDLIVSNPPYVDPADETSLAPGVRAHEPAAALFAPEGDPDHWVRRLLDESLELLAEEGLVLIELGHDQAERALGLAQERGWSARTHADLAGVPRVLEARPAPRPRGGPGTRGPRHPSR